MPRRLNAGCITCKSRHLRCDERLPTCANYLKSLRPCQYLDPLVPSTKPDRCLMLRTFVDSASMIMDPTDDHRIFGTIGAQLALSHEPLLYSICAIIALQRHMPDAQEYYDLSISLLSPYLAHQVADWVLMSTVILRVYQEMSQMESPLHLLGSIALLTSTQGTSRIRKACFFGVLRQDISTSLRTRSRLRFETSQLIRVHDEICDSPVSDAERADEMTYLLTLTMTHDFPRPEIKSLLDSWVRDLPVSFEAIYKASNEWGRIQYLHSWHAIALGQWHCAMALSSDSGELSQFHAQRILRIAMYDSHHGVQVHLGSMFGLCFEILGRDYEGRIRETAEMISKTCGFPISWAEQSREVNDQSR